MNLRNLYTVSTVFTLIFEKDNTSICIVCILARILNKTVVYIGKVSLSIVAVQVDTCAATFLSLFLGTKDIPTPLLLAISGGRGTSLQGQSTVAGRSFFPEIRYGRTDPSTTT